MTPTSTSRSIDVRGYVEMLMDAIEQAERTLRALEPPSIHHDRDRPELRARFCKRLVTNVSILSLLPSRPSPDMLPFPAALPSSLETIAASLFTAQIPPTASSSFETALWIRNHPKATVYSQCLGPRLEEMRSLDVISVAG